MKDIDFDAVWEKAVKGKLDDSNKEVIEFLRKNQVEAPEEENKKKTSEIRLGR